MSASCPPDLDIDDLATKVKDLASDHLVGVSPISINAYHSSAIRLDFLDDQLQATISELDLDKASVSPAEIVSKIVTGRELLILKKPNRNREFFAAWASHVELIHKAEAPSKRSLPPSALTDHFQRHKRTRLAQEAPSKMALPSQYDKIQANPEEKIFDDRPQPDPLIAPIALLYHFYGEFHDIYAGRPLPDDMQSTIDLCEMEKRVLAFTAAMSCRYPEELNRRDVGNKHLGAILMFPITAREIGNVCSNGHCLAAGVISTIVEWKNELVGINAFPGVQCVGYVSHSHTYLDALEGKGNLWRIPALGITIIVGLTSPISCTLSAINDFERQQLHRAFIAAHILQRRIHNDLDLYLSKTTPPPSAFTEGEYFVPAVTKIREDGRDDANKNHIQFKILDYHAGSDEHLYQGRHLYLARVTQPGHKHESNEILVKFSQSYSIDLHDFCHKQGHAPRVLGYERLPGGWFAIAMEYLANTKSIDSGLIPERRIELQGLVTKFHGQGLVHGDLRSGNILYNDDNFWLIDFDWGGKAGVVAYPTWLLHEDLLSGRQSKDLTIRIEDDLRILNATLENLKPQGAHIM
ncbi:hypothetical protein D9619_010327 [Psilocybe cf. subviscida]|uniref:Uncharacterized protein n=1 Tax=Psilocybe cf. subviscida TaxID=2480587 RepID=A0A8H5ASM2_9AGAR|nr:hypothetical protein D9619_010327 [Psilocybe cf. subviscida]